MSLDTSFLGRQSAIQDEKEWDEAVDAFFEQVESAIDDALDVLPQALLVGMVESLKMGLLMGDEDED